MRVRASKLTPNKLAWLIREYMESDQFKKNSVGTQDSWGRELRFAAQPDQMGDLTVKEARPALTQAFLDGFSDRPYKQRSAITALRQFEKWAILRDKLPRQITFGIQMPPADTGHTPWEEEYVALAEGLASEQMRRAVTLAVNTGQRGSDLVRMRYDDLEEIGGRLGIHVVQWKTKKVLWIPFSQEFATTVRQWRGAATSELFLWRPSGRPWTRHKLSLAWAEERESNPSLKLLAAQELVLHGLRGTCCVRFCRKGLTDVQIGKLIGMSPAMVSRYTRFSRQQNDALAAMAQFDR